MNKSTILNVPGIQKHIRSKHKKFLKDVGIFSRKISEDHQLQLTRLVARISRIMECFVEEGIIDSFAPCNAPYMDSEYARIFLIRKKEFVESVYLWTDGNVAIISDSVSPLFSNDCETIRFTDLDKSDGLDFSVRVLDYIQKKIYSRKESYEQRLFGISDPIEPSTEGE